VRKESSGERGLVEKGCAHGYSSTLTKRGGPVRVHENFLELTAAKIPQTRPRNRGERCGGLPVLCGSEISRRGSQVPGEAPGSDKKGETSEAYQ